MLNHHPPKLMESTLKMAEFDGPLATQGELPTPHFWAVCLKIGKTQKSHSWSSCSLLKLSLIGGQSPIFRHPQNHSVIVVIQYIQESHPQNPQKKMLSLIHKFGSIRSQCPVNPFTFAEKSTASPPVSALEAVAVSDARILRPPRYAEPRRQGDLSLSNIKGRPGRPVHPQECCGYGYLDKHEALSPRNFGGILFLAALAHLKLLWNWEIDAGGSLLFGSLSCLALLMYLAGFLSTDRNWAPPKRLGWYLKYVKTTNHNHIINPNPNVRDSANCQVIATCPYHSCARCDDWKHAPKSLVRNQIFKHPPLPAASEGRPEGTSFISPSIKARRCCKDSSWDFRRATFAVPGVPRCRTCAVNENSRHCGMTDIHWYPTYAVRITATANSDRILAGVHARLLLQFTHPLLQRRFGGSHLRKAALVCSSV